MFSFFGGGHGGHPEGDGLNHGNAPISTATIPPLEILEAAYPVMFTQWALRPNSGGPGRHRGGLGAIYEIELLEQNADVFLFGERGKYPPPGVLGGKAGAYNRFTYQQDDGEHQPPFVSKMVGIKLKQGQRVRLETPGGGGYGSPLERDPQAVARDVQLGYVGPEEALSDYEVTLTAEGEVAFSPPLLQRGARGDLKLQGGDFQQPKSSIENPPQPPFAKGGSNINGREPL
jgi:N-methylhydantoinase B